MPGAIGVINGGGKLDCGDAVPEARCRVWLSIERVGNSFEQPFEPAPVSTRGLDQPVDPGLLLGVAGDR